MVNFDILPTTVVVALPGTQIGLHLSPTNAVPTSSALPLIELWWFFNMILPSLFLDSVGINLAILQLHLTEL